MWARRIFGLVRRDRPNRFVEIKVGPFGKAQFARPDKDMRQQPKRHQSVRTALERIERAEKLACCLGNGDGGPIEGLGDDQGTTQVCRHITFGARRGDRIPKNLRAVLRSRLVVS